MPAFMLVILILCVAPGSRPARKNNKASGTVHTELPLNVLVIPFKDYRTTNQVPKRHRNGCEQRTTEYNPFSRPTIPLTTTALPPVNESDTLAPFSVVAWNGAEIVELGTPLTLLIDQAPEYRREAVLELS